MIAIFVGSCVSDEPFPRETSDENAAICRVRKNFSLKKIPLAGDYFKGIQAAADGQVEQAPSFGQL